MNPSFYTVIIPLAEPITVQVPAYGYPRPRVINADGEQATDPVTLTELDVAFWIAPMTRTIHAQIAHLPVPLLIWGAEDFPHVVTDTPADHAQRLLQILGPDPAAVLQPLCDRMPLPPLPPRVPREIAAWRAKAVIELAGLLPQVEALIASVPDEAAVIVRRAWEDNAPLQRYGQTVLTLSAALDLSDAQLDAMFIQAAALEV
jgi:hypothetical protein